MKMLTLHSRYANCLSWKFYFSFMKDSYSVKNTQINRLNLFLKGRKQGYIVLFVRPTKPEDGSNTESYII